MKLRILHVIPNIERGGAERAMLLMARGATSHGYDVRVIVLGDKNAYPELIPQRVCVEHLNYSLTYRKVTDTFTCYRRLNRIYQEVAPDIIHSHLWPAARMAAWARRQDNIPHVVHIQDTMNWLAAKDFRSRMMRFLTRWALRRSNIHFIAVGDAVKEYTLQHLPWIPKNVRVIHNAFDDEIFGQFRIFEERPVGQGIRLGTAARLVPNKGIDRCLRALANARIDAPWEYWIAGDGSQRETWSRLADELGIGNRVRFLGTVTDMPSFYGELHIYIQPSLSLEGLPLVLVEAMASGLPVIATDVGATGELVRHGMDGFVIPPDDIAAIASAVKTLAYNGEIRLKMAESAHRRAWSEFSSTRMAQKVLDFYAEILSTKSLLAKQTELGSSSTS